MVFYVTRFIIAKSTLEDKKAELKEIEIKYANLNSKIYAMNMVDLKEFNLRMDPPPEFPPIQELNLETNSNS